jgi:hypothetical protein
MSCILDHNQYCRSSTNTDVDLLFSLLLVVVVQVQYTNKYDISRMHHLARIDGLTPGFCSFQLGFRWPLVPLATCLFSSVTFDPDSTRR